MLSHLVLLVLAATHGEAGQYSQSCMKDAECEAGWSCTCIVVLLLNLESLIPSSLCVHPSYPPAARTRTHSAVSPRHRVPWRNDLLEGARHSQRSTGTVRVITTVPLTRRLQERTRMQDWIFYNETLCMQYVTKITQFSIFP